MSRDTSNNFVIQLGTSGGFITSGYDSSSAVVTGTSSGSSSSGFVLINTNDSHVFSGEFVIQKMSSSVYVEAHNMHRDGSVNPRVGAGKLTGISGTIDRLRMTALGGNFDSGSYTVYVE